MLISDQEYKSLENLVQEKAFESLEIWEAVYLFKAAKKLDQPGVKIYSHRDAWK